jgi:hypothetical protein
MKLEFQLAAGTVALPGLSARSAKVIQCFTRDSTCSKRPIYASHFTTLGLRNYCGQKKAELHAATFCRIMKTKRNLISILALAAVMLPRAVQAQFTFTTNNDAITISGYTGSGGAVVIPDTTNGYPVIGVGNNAFQNKTSVTSFTMGTNITSIGTGAFNSCSSLTVITVATNNPAYSSADGVLFNKSQTMLIQFPGGRAGSYTIPDSVTSVGDNAFTACPNLISVTIGNSVTRIGVGAFYECTSLTNVAIGAGLTSIGFDGFDQCYSLRAITVDSLNPAFSSVYGVLFNRNLTKLIRCPGGIAGSVTIPNSVTNIGDYAFLNDYRLNAVYFEGNAPSLGSLVFDDALTVFYRPGTTGWTSTLGGMPTELWNPQPQNDANFGVRTNRLGFNITGSSNLVIVVEACANLAVPVWTPIGTNTLNTFIGTNGTSYFSDSQWTNFPGRYYRLRSP